jgi:HAD superfamily hydrolase (TIGR01549 family)
MTRKDPDSPVKVALFDLDNTLFDRTTTYRLWAKGYAETTGLGESDVEWFCEMDQDGLADRRAIWTQAQKRFGLSASVEDLLTTYRSAYLDLCEPDGAVQAALAALRGDGWRIGIVTNGPMPDQAAKAERLGLLPFIDAFCGSGELGVAKPDRRIFDEAIVRCTGGRPLDQADRWMVGDAPVPDIGGARAVGLRTIWLDRGRCWDADDGDPPEVTVGALVDAVQTILSHPV